MKRNSPLSLFAASLSAILFAITLTSAPASAQDSWYAADNAGDGKLGLVWVEDELRNGNPASFLQWYGSNGEVGICQSLLDPRCSSGARWSARAILSRCEVGLNEACIRSLRVSGPDGKLIEAEFVRSIDASIFEADPSRQIPRGGSVGVWRVPGVNHSGGSDLYSAAVKLEYTSTPGQARPELFDFQASVVPIRLASGDYRKMQLIEYKDEARGGAVFPVWDHSVGNCAWQEVGTCAIAQQWHQGAQVSLQLHLPKKVTGWLYGRMSNPRIQVSPINSELNSVSITAKPVTVQGSKPLINFNDIPSQMRSFLTNGGRNPFPKGPGYENGGWVWQIPTSSSDNFKWFEQWFPYTGDKADGLVDYWNVKSIPSTNLRAICLRSETQLVGMVTSNALLYSGNPPQFVDEELVYEVASLHYEPDGKTKFIGSYDLILRSEAARCLYRLSDRPVSAKVEIINSDGTTQVATTSLQEKDGWINLSANGFTYSRPKIQVKFEEAAQPVEAKTTTGPGVGGPTATTKKRTISCRKGAVIKKVTSTSPKCPKGFRRA